MKFNITRLLRIYYTKVTQSIAFYPALIAIGFLILTYTMIQIDFSPWGKELKSRLSWLILEDAETARSIISTIAGAIISLTVFSFSMVMIILTQAASQMSNRVLSYMIENRFQQTVLGIYIGTIVYALFLLSTIRELSSGIHIPALSIYTLILLTVFDIFLFIYFLDYVTQTVKYETIINRIKRQTRLSIHEKFKDEKDEKITWTDLPYVDINAYESNYFQSFNERKLLEIAAEENLHISFLFKQTTFLLKGTPFIRVYSKDIVGDDILDQIIATADLYSGQSIDNNTDYGFIQLAEIAIKALSPAVNDPGTAVIALNSLSDLLSNRLYSNLPRFLLDKKHVVRIFIPTSTFEELFEKSLHPIWNYGKKDEYIQRAFLNIIEQLKIADIKHLYTNSFDFLISKINIQIKPNLTV